MMNVCIADDEPLALERLTQMLSLIDDVQITGQARNGEDMIHLIKDRQPDLVLIDIEMPRLDGFDVVEALSSTALETDPPLFIFATAYPGMAAQAFETGAIDFLTKPVRPSRLDLALSRARANLETRDALGRLERLQSHIEELRRSRSNSGLRSEAVWVSKGGQSVRVDLKTIDYVEADAEYIRLYTGERSLLHRQSISSFEKDYADLGFVRIHRSYVIRATNCVGLSRSSWGGLQVQLESGQTLPVGRTYKDKLSSIIERHSA
jgi:two-component system LytT family response regulator